MSYDYYTTSRNDYLVGKKTRLKSELVVMPCPLCNHTHLLYRESPFFQFGCYGDTHYHLYCGKCHNYICTECNPEFIEMITKMIKSHRHVRYGVRLSVCCGLDKL